jgi:hypothetical protein
LRCWRWSRPGPSPAPPGSAVPPGRAAARPASDAGPGRGLAGMRAALAAVGALSLIALAVLGGSVTAATSAPAGGPTTASGTPVMLKTSTIGGVTVLTNAKRAHAVLVRPGHRRALRLLRHVRRLLAAGHRRPSRRLRRHRPGRNDQPHRRRHPGDLQRHPLSTYVGDTAPGQASGNNLDLNGGFWHEVTPAG